MPLPIGPLPKSIATVSLSGTLAEKMEAAAAIGFDGVEIFENDLLTFDGTPADVRGLADSLGLAITCFQPFRDFEAMPEPQRSRNMDRVERKFDVMQALGAELLLVCSNVNPASLDDVRGRRPTWRRWRNGRQGGVCAWGWRLWPGAATSAAGGTRGVPCNRRTIPLWA